MAQNYSESFCRGLLVAHFASAKDGCAAISATPTARSTVNQLLQLVLLRILRCADSFLAPSLQRRRAAGGLEHAAPLWRGKLQIGTPCPSSFLTSFISLSAPALLEDRLSSLESCADYGPQTSAQLVLATSFGSPK